LAAKSGVGKYSRVWILEESGFNEGQKNLFSEFTSKIVANFMLNTNFSTDDFSTIHLSEVEKEIKMILTDKFNKMDYRATLIAADYVKDLSTLIHSQLFPNAGMSETPSKL
jgi:hypothetical protein